MQPRISFITLGVTDLERAVKFYREGLQLPMKNDGEGVAFFEMSGLILALYPRENLADDANVDHHGSGFRSFALAHNVQSPEAVDDQLDEAARAGGRILKRGQKTFWGGYAGYFADPDDHVWEIAWNPGFDIERGVMID